jgi:hypothetical protein
MIMIDRPVVVINFAIYNSRQPKPDCFPAFNALLEWRWQPLLSNHTITGCCDMKIYGILDPAWLVYGVLHVLCKARSCWPSTSLITPKAAVLMLLSLFKVASSFAWILGWVIDLDGAHLQVIELLHFCVQPNWLTCFTKKLWFEFL